ncbi:MAG: DUF2789 domain-containing protein [Marinobacterium sp.]|nr:DUF2789 domain-containing protein [Marinobacterium sp.]
MDTSAHTLNALFSQLGLPSSDRDIDRFIATHQLYSDSIPLPEATFWSPSQASFLREALEQDADWCEPVDMLDSRLRIPHKQ